jgi:hypothetical protein
MTVLSIIGWILSIPAIWTLSKSGTEKIIKSNESVQNFQFMKLQNYRLPIGILEVLGVALFIFPATSLYGLLIIVSVMSGAVAMHLSLMGGNKMWFPLMIGGLSVISFFIR